jgi:hypothetical protein
MTGTPGNAGPRRMDDLALPEEPGSATAASAPDLPGTAGAAGGSGAVDAAGAVDPADAAVPAGGAEQAGDVGGAEGTEDAELEMPPPPEHVIEAARLAPDHWFGMIDPTWSGAGDPPDWARVGSWLSDANGEIVGWQDNENYRPSPRALGWPDPTDPVDAAVYLATTGYGPAEDITRALADAEIAVFVAPGGAPLCAVAPDDETPVVPVFTSPQYLQAAGRLSYQALKAAELLDRIPEGHLLFLNPSGPVSMTLELGPLREAIEGVAEAGAGAGEAGAGVAEAGAGAVEASEVGEVGEAAAEAGEGSEAGWLGALDDLLPAPPSAESGASAFPGSGSAGSVGGSSSVRAD